MPEINGQELEQCPQIPAPCSLLCLPEAGNGVMRGKKDAFRSYPASVSPPFPAFKKHLPLQNR